MMATKQETKAVEQVEQQKPVEAKATPAPKEKDGKKVTTLADGTVRTDH